MLSKIYLVILAAALVIMGILTFLCYSWLQSIGSPAAVVENYTAYSGVSWTVLWISFISLVVTANVLLWKDGKTWPLWAALLFFVAFIVVQTFWLDKTFFAFMKTNNLAEDGYFLKPFVGVTISAVAAIGIFFNQFIILRLRGKTFATVEETANEETVQTDSES